jgi:hypothetical protein
MGTNGVIPNMGSNPELRVSLYIQNFSCKTWRDNTTFKN